MTINNLHKRDKRLVHDYSSILENLLGKNHTLIHHRNMQYLLVKILKVVHGSIDNEILKAI